MDKCFIKIGKCSRNFLIILSLMLFWLLRAIIIYYQNKNYSHFCSPLFFSFFSSIGFVLGGFLEVISAKLRTKNSQVQEQEIKIVEGLTMSFDLVARKENIIDSLLDYLIILPLSIALCINYPFYILVDNHSKYKVLNKMKAGHILFDVALAKLLLHYPIYRHQVLSIVIILLGLCLILFDYFAEYWFECIYCFLYYICYALPDVLIKLIANRKPIGIFKLMFIDGIIMIAINVFCFIVMGLIKCTEPTFFPCTNGVIENVLFTCYDYFSTDTLARVFYTLGYVVIHFGYITFFHLTIYYFTPIHRGMSDSFSALLFLIFKLIIRDANEMDSFTVYAVIGYVIIVISTLIYNEFIILSFWSLDEYTKQAIEQRSILDQSMKIEELVEDGSIVEL